MFQVVFNRDGKPLRHYRDLSGVDMARYGAFRHALLRQGVHLNGSGSACWFISTVHSADDLAIATAAIEKAMRAVR